MTEILEPDLDTLIEYVYERLPEDEARAIRTWLYTGATEADLAVFEGLLQERRTAARTLAETAAHPARARAMYLLHKMHEAASTAFCTLLPVGREPALGSLAGRVQGGVELVLEVHAGEPVDVELSFREGGYYAVYVLDPLGRIIDWPRAQGAVRAGTRIHLDGIEFEPGDREIEIVVVLDSSTPLPHAPDGADADWLVALLDESSHSRRVLRQSVRCAPLLTTPPREG